MSSDESESLNARSLKCCKRRSVLSDLQGFGQRWQRSRKRIAILNPSPHFSEHLTLVATLFADQGHAVTVYCSAPPSAEVLGILRKSPLRLRARFFPRIVRLTALAWLCEETAVSLFSLILALRVLLGCLVSWVFRLARQLSYVEAKSDEIFDVCIFYEHSFFPQLILHNFCKYTIFVPLGEPGNLSFFENFQVFRFLRDRLESPVTRTVVSSDLEAVGFRTVSVVYPPIDLLIRGLCISRSSGEVAFGGPFILTLDREEAPPEDFALSTAAFEIFAEKIGKSEDGRGAGLAKPRLVVLSDRENLEISFPLTEQNFKKALKQSLCLLHTPTGVNEVAIPCYAMHATRPVVTCVSQCTIEPVRHGATGFISRAPTPEAVSDALILMWKSDWGLLGARARQRVESEFSTAAFSKRIDDLLETLK